MSFFQPNDPFAALEGSEDDNILEFEDTYDGLGDQLDETNDAFNDETFGGGSLESTARLSQPSKPDFDFFGQTAKVADAIHEEQVRFSRQQPTARKPSAAAPPPVTQTQYQSYTPEQPFKPIRTGYEKYKEPEKVPDMEVDASIWGVAPKKYHNQPPPSDPAVQATKPATNIPSAAGRKMLSLEEVEAQMRAQAKIGHQPTSTTSSFPGSGQGQTPVPAPSHGPGLWSQGDFSARFPTTLPGQPQVPAAHTPPVSEPSPFGVQQPQQFSQRHQQPFQPHSHTQSHIPQHIQQQNQRQTPGIHSHPGHHTQGSLSGHMSMSQTNSNLSDAAQLELDAKRAKRNHKIFLMSRDNGLMTPSDKNFVSRIQLQQLVAATGNPNEPGAEDLVEDFYFQVLSQIRGGHRQHPNQPLNNFAQTYLFQTGNRHHGMRRHGRFAESHMQRMEQQVQRAVEAAKTKPKNKQLVIEGSLGKISFSNAKTPKPLLNIKRAESGTHQTKSQASTIDRKTVLKTIEQVYTTLMDLEDMERKMPPPMVDDDPELAQHHAEFQNRQGQLINRLWVELKFHEPIGAAPIHPFIAFLAFPKGKKAIPRIFRLVTDEQRKIMLTMIIVHLDQLDVVRMGHEPDAATREAIDLFSSSVMPPLFSFFNGVDMGLAIGAIGIIIRNVNIDIVTRSRTGIAFLTMILSRPELVKTSGGADDASWQEW